MIAPIFSPPIQSMKFHRFPGENGWYDSDD
nr:MAG TPA: NAD(P)H-quinone oxidoreductase subunit 1 [Caudoviricetes sp.]